MKALVLIDAALRRVRRAWAAYVGLTLAFSAIGLVFLARTQCVQYQRLSVSVSCAIGAVYTAYPEFTTGCSWLVLYGLTLALLRIEVTQVPRSWRAALLLPLALIPALGLAHAIAQDVAHIVAVLLFPDLVFDPLDLADSLGRILWESFAGANCLLVVFLGGARPITSVWCLRSLVDALGLAAVTFLIVAAVAALSGVSVRVLYWHWTTDLTEIVSALGAPLALLLCVPFIGDLFAAAWAAEALCDQNRDSLPLGG